MNHSHLTTSDWIISPHETLDAVHNYRQALAEAGQTVDDEVVWNALDCLALEPAGNRFLHPLNWRKKMPRLDIFATITPMRHFVIALSPSRDSLGEAVRDGKVLRNADDFWEFPFPPDVSNYPRLNFLDMPLGEVGRYTDKKSGDADLDTRLALQRQIVSCIYEYVVKRLSALFECRMREILVSYGSQHFLETRRVGADGEQAERADLIAYDAVHWHPALEPLCKQLGVEVDKLLAFYRDHLARLELHRQAHTLADYLGGSLYRSRRERKDAPDIHDVLRVLRVACDPATYPPLVAGEPGRFERVFAEAGSDSLETRWETLARRYEIDRAQLVDLMRALDIEAFDALPHGGAAIRDEIDLLAGNDLLGSARHRKYDERFQTALAVALEQPESGGAPPIPSKRLLAQCGRFRSFSAMQAWAEAMAPQTAAWLNEVISSPKKSKRSQSQAQEA